MNSSQSAAARHNLNPRMVVRGRQWEPKQIKLSVGLDRDSLTHGNTGLYKTIPIHAYTHLGPEKNCCASKLPPWRILKGYPPSEKWRPFNPPVCVLSWETPAPVYTSIISALSLNHLVFVATSTLTTFGWI